NLPYAGYNDLAAKAEVYDLIQDCVQQVNADLVSDPKLADSQVSRFLILHKELDPDDDELTRTRKVRRGFIAQKYSVLVDAMFAGKDSQYVETQVKFEDGRSGMVSATLRIADAKRQPSLAKAA
ncbi:MAG: long-chain fatty acid--CoA ligase, partial [Betaproteobacteria bacterium]|nr:long-chain fatty acid--CoA ligase [Betaproteobacteria bacterium]